MSELEYLIDRAKTAGAEEVDTIQLDGASVSLSYRQGEVENMGRSEEAEVGLRVIVGKRQAVTSTSDLSKSSLDKLVERAMDMVKVVPEDPFIGLADSSEFSSQVPSPSPTVDEVSSDELLQRTKDTEAAALAVPGIKQSEGASAHWGYTSYRILTSKGFEGSHTSTQQSLSCMAVAGEGEAMQRDYEASVATSAADLLTPETIGTRAAERAVKRLNPRKIPTGQYPIVYDRRIGGHYLVTPLVNAIDGMSIARGTSFLRDALNQPLFGDGVSIIDDPSLPNGLGSRPFDREGIPCTKQAIVENGVLKSWLLNLHAARQLGLDPTGHAYGGISSPPQIKPSNFFIAPGSLSPTELVKEAGTGLYVTELMGFGINGITGDYSLGVSGFWIENGEISYPVSEVTIAGNLKEMYRNLVPANDLVRDANVCAPTVLIESMMVAGQ